MSIVSRIAYLIGTVLIAHSGYSSYEFNQFIKSSSSTLELPLDIKLEAIAGLILFVIGSLIAVISPHQYTLLENDPIYTAIPQNDSALFKPIKMNKATVELEKLGAGPFEQIENKAAFIDILKKRREFDEWVMSKE
ncbi:Emc5 protein [Saccharomycopsis crataegensis]|uniref:Emc5 protein n=1 Tax=Saccharomycopsis crataegensis TaxID=43959 RepID=A0AAV5QPY9_9ASCO|nr:Emc5 protein [Saccharomycopsis crataegensis]